MYIMKYVNSKEAVREKLYNMALRYFMWVTQILVFLILDRSY